MTFIYLPTRVTYLRDMSEDGKLQETLTSSGISFKLSKPTGGSKLDPSLIVKEKESEKNDKDYLVSVEGKELQR